MAGPRRDGRRRRSFTFSSIAIPSYHAARLPCIAAPTCAAIKNDTGALRVVISVARVLQTCDRPPSAHSSNERAQDTFSALRLNWALVLVSLAEDTRQLSSVYRKISKSSL